MEITKQLAVFLDNRPGALARVCEAFEEKGINIHALTTSDTVDHSVVRMVVDDPQSAIWLLEENGGMVVEDEVFKMITVLNQFQKILMTFHKWNKTI